MRIEDLILVELKQRQPARLLAEGRAAQALAAAYLEACADCALAATTEQAELALAFVGEDKDKAAAYALIGQLKQKAPVVLVAAQENLPLGLNDFLSFGMQRLGEAGEHVLYVFDLHTYKPAPDWLNPRYWAHPELWKP